MSTDIEVKDENLINDTCLYPFPVLKNNQTLMRQCSVPRLPVPNLESTVNYFLEALKPLVSETDYNEAEKVISELTIENGIGHKLQELLIHKSKITDNWLIKWWIDKIYLKPRDSILINLNTGILYPRADYNSLNEQILFATKYISGFFEYTLRLNYQIFPPEKIGNSYLCMDHHSMLIGTCRIPKLVKDGIKIMQAYNLDLKKSNHITVIYNNKIFSMQVIDPESGQALSPVEIYSNLKNIVETHTRDSIGVGLLTADKRDSWSYAYDELSKNENNRKNLESIQDSLFVLCLDVDDNQENNNRSLNSSQILHGNKKFTSNRWFDKTIQVIFGSNGVWGINFEHTVSDATPHIFMNDFIYDHMLRNNEMINQDSTAIKNRVEELKFELSHKIHSKLINLESYISSFIDEIDVKAFRFSAFGKDFPKSQKVSPDAFFQISLQLAYYRFHNKPGNSYESCSLRRFHLGRTESIRSCTTETIEFLKSMQSGGSLHDETIKESAKNLFIRALTSHRTFTNRAINFESFDRHLMGLRLTAIENQLDVPKIFSHKTYQQLINYELATSQVASKYETVTSFAPWFIDGYACCYNLNEKNILFSVVAYNKCKTICATKMGTYIQNALLDCQKLFLPENS